MAGAEASFDIGPLPGKHIDHTIVEESKVGVADSKNGPAVKIQPADDSALAESFDSFTDIVIKEEFLADATLHETPIPMASAAPDDVKDPLSGFPVKIEPPDDTEVTEPAIAMSRRFFNGEEIRAELERADDDTNEPDLPSSEEEDCVDKVLCQISDKEDPDNEPNDSSESEVDVTEFVLEDAEEDIESAISNAEFLSVECPSSSLCNPPEIKYNANKKGRKRKANDDVGAPATTGRQKKDDDGVIDDSPFIIKYDSTTVRGREDIKNCAFVWQTQPITLDKNKAPKQNVIHTSPGPVGYAREVIEPIDCFSLFVTPQMLLIIMDCTNRYIINNSSTSKNGCNSEIEDVEELKALLGLLIYAAAKKDNHLPTKMMFDFSHCGEWYRSAMPRFRFEFLINSLRFDDKDTRNPDIKLGPISEIWELFLSNCRAHYRPGSYLTIDEQLIGFRGNCPFRMYLPDKPDKYGIKNIVICDSSTKYMLDGIIYTGKGSTAGNGSVTTFLVNKLVESVKNTNRNVTFDNRFTSVPLVSELLKNGLTAIGTIRKNKRELPPSFTDPKFKRRKVGSSLFIYHQDMTAVSYKTKNNKVVSLVSSMHSSPEVHPFSKKPYIIRSYNATKGAVETLDQLCSNVSCNRKTKRWPLCVFYNMLNLACVNSYVVYKHNFYRKQQEKKRDKEAQESSDQTKNDKTNGKKSGGKSSRPLRKQIVDKPLSRLQFMTTLHEQLTYNWKKMRLEAVKNMNSDLKFAIPRTLSRSAVPTQQYSASPPEAESSQRPKPTRTSAVARKYCSICPSSARRKTSTSCAKCFRLICGAHQKKFCPDC